MKEIDSIFNAESGEFVLNANPIWFELNSGKFELSCAVSSMGFPELDGAFSKWLTEKNEDVVIRFKFSLRQFQEDVSYLKDSRGLVKENTREAFMNLRRELMSAVEHIDSLGFDDQSSNGDLSDFVLKEMSQKLMEKEENWFRNNSIIGSGSRNPQQ